MKIDYKIDSGSSSEIYEHLEKCSSSFVPDLSTYVEIKEYSDKIIKKSRRFEAYHGKEMIALIAVYVNDVDSFITNFTRISW